MDLAYETVTANGLDFAALTAGSGPLALCLHGFPDTAWTYRRLLPELARAGFRAVAPFMRGYAPTEVPQDGAYQTGALAADAIALHEALGGDEHAVIVGHDWGAMAAYGATVHAPDRWRRVVTMAVPPLPIAGRMFFDFEQLKRSFYVFLFQTSLAETVVGLDDLAFIDGLWRDWSPGYDAVEDVAHVKDSLRTPAHLRAAIGYYRAMLDHTTHLDKYAAEQTACAGIPSQPTLYLHGTIDGALGAECVTDAKSVFTGDSSFEWIDGTGHFLHVEKPAEVNAKIVDWLTR